MPVVSGERLCVGAVGWALPASDEGRRRIVLVKWEAVLSLSSRINTFCSQWAVAWRLCTYFQSARDKHDKVLLHSTSANLADELPVGGQRNSQHLIDTYICSHYIWMRLLLFRREAGEWQQDLSRLQRLSPSSMIMDVLLSTDMSTNCKYLFPAFFGCGITGKASSVNPSPVAWGFFALWKYAYQ